MSMWNTRAQLLVFGTERSAVMHKFATWGLGEMMCQVTYCQKQRINIGFGSIISAAVILKAMVNL